MGDVTDYADPNAQLNPDPQEQYPQEANPQEPYPQEQYPQEQYPQEQYPQEQYPQEQYPQEQYPQEQYPQEQYPQEQYPQEQYPQEPFYPPSDDAQAGAYPPYGDQTPGTYFPYGGQEAGAYPPYGDPAADETFATWTTSGIVPDMTAGRYGSRVPPDKPPGLLPSLPHEALLGNIMGPSAGTRKYVFGRGAMSPAAIMSSRPGGFPMDPVSTGGKGPYGMPTGMDVTMLHGALSKHTHEEDISEENDGEYDVDISQTLLEEEMAMIARTEGPGEFWGFVETPRGRQIARKFYIAGEDGLQITLTNYGARITSVRMPDIFGGLDEVVVGLDNLSDYELVEEYCLGCVLGRMSYPMIGPIQEEGFSSFQEMVWEAHLKSSSNVVFSLHSFEGEQDYPGDVLATAEYSLEPGNHLLLRLAATSTATTPLSMSVRVPFNLAGQRSGSIGVYDHHLMINARKFLALDKDQMPTGEIHRTRHHGLGFLAPTFMADAFQRGPDNGFDHHLILNGYPTDDLRFVARLTHQVTGRAVEIYSNTQCLHIDTLNDLIPPEPQSDYEGEFEEGEKMPVPVDRFQIEAPPVEDTQPPLPAPTENPPDYTEEMGEEGESGSSEIWGEAGGRTGELGEAGEAEDLNIRDLEDEDVRVKIRLPYDLSKHCGIVLAPEDYPDTIFDKHNAFILKPGKPYERLIRFSFSTEILPDIIKRVTIGGGNKGDNEGGDGGILGWAIGLPHSQPAPTPATPASPTTPATLISL